MPEWLAYQFDVNTLIKATTAIDQVLEQLEKKHRGLMGAVVLRADSPAVLRSTFPDTARTYHYASLAFKLLEVAKSNTTKGSTQADDVTLLRLRTSTSEIVITPDSGFILVAVHSITSS